MIDIDYEIVPFSFVCRSCGSDNNGMGESQMKKIEKVLVFYGEVEGGDGYRIFEDEEEGAVLIGGRDVVGEIGALGFKGSVVVGIAKPDLAGVLVAHGYDGDIDTDMGWGYSEYTPMDSDLLKVGEHDLIEILDRYEGEKIILWISDGPINIFEHLPPKEIE